MPDPLPEELRLALCRTADRRGPFGDPLVFFLETGSTNDIATRLADSGAPHGATVVAAAQTAGRGRMGREWFSPPGAGLYASIVCRSQRAAPLLTLAGGVAAAEGILRATALPVTIKWPNDIVVSDSTSRGRRKLAGILAEGSTGADGMHYVVLGFGINLRRAAYPAAIADRATSLEIELGRAVDGAPVLAETLAALNVQIDALESGRRADVLARWRALAPTSIGATVEWTAHGAPRRGLTAGIDDDGALRVKAGRQVERIIAGELTWL